MLPTLTRASRVLAQALGSVFNRCDVALSRWKAADGLRSNSRRATLEKLEDRTLMSTYYVSPSGNDNSSGTSVSSPWKSIGKVNSVTLHGGDSVLFQGGQTFYGSLNIGSKDSSSSQVIFGSYNGQATINSGKSNGATVLNASGIWFENLKFVGSPGSTPQSGINFEGYSAGSFYTNDKVDDCNISGYRTAGILVEGAYSNGGFNGLRITNSVIHDNVDSGIQTCSAADTSLINFYIGHNQVYNNYGDGYSVCTGSGIELGDVSNALVEYNTAYLNGSRGGNGGVGIWAYTANNVTFQYNESYDNISTRGMDGDGFDFDLDVSNSVMQYNYAFGNDGTGAQLDQWKTDNGFVNDIVRYNVFQDNGKLNKYGNLEVWGKVENAYLYNNTIFTTSSNSNAAIRIHNSTIPGLYVNGVHFINNIIDTTGGATLINIPEGEAQGAANLTFTGNVYWASGYTPVFIDGNKTLTSLAAWRSAGQETWGGTKYGIYADPKFDSANGGAVASVLSSVSNLVAAASGYKLQSSSPALSETSNIFSMYGVATGGHDFFNDTIASNATTVAGADQSSRAATSSATIAAASGSTSSSSSSSIGTAPSTNVSNLMGYDLGSVSSKGSNSSSSGSFTIKASGAGITGTSDQLRYDETSLTGDGSIIAKVSSSSSSSSTAQAGVMIRNVLSANSAEVSMLISPDAIASFESRGSTGGSTTTKAVADSGWDWIKLVRVSNTFIGYISSDGINWTMVSSATVATNSTVMVGLAVSAHLTGGTDTAVFSNVNIV
jgi:hypothetical protein